MGNAKFIERNLQPLTPRIPLDVELTLAPEDQAHTSEFTVSGGKTNNKTVTILGKTTPNSLVFSDSGLGDYSFAGTFVPVDQTGRFSIQVTNTQGINNYEFLVIDPYGQQTIRLPDPLDPLRPGEGKLIEMDARYPDIGPERGGLGDFGDLGSVATISAVFLEGAALTGQVEQRQDGTGGEGAPADASYRLTE